MYFIHSTVHMMRCKFFTFEPHCFADLDTPMNSEGIWYVILQVVYPLISVWLFVELAEKCGQLGADSKELMDTMKSGELVRVAPPPPPLLLFERVCVTIQLLMCHVIIESPRFGVSD